MKKYVILALIVAALLVPLVANANMPSDLVKINKLSSPEPLNTRLTDPAVFHNISMPFVMPSEIVRINKILPPELLNSTFTNPEVFKDPLFQNPNFLHYVP